MEAGWVPEEKSEQEFSFSMIYMLNIGIHVTNLCHVVTLSDSEDFKCVLSTSKYEVSNDVSLGSILLKP